MWSITDACFVWDYSFTTSLGLLRKTEEWLNAWSASFPKMIVSTSKNLRAVLVTHDFSYRRGGVWHFLISPDEGGGIWLFLKISD